METNHQPATGSFAITKDSKRHLALKMVGLSETQIGVIAESLRAADALNDSSGADDWFAARKQIDNCVELLSAKASQHNIEKIGTESRPEIIKEELGKLLKAFVFELGQMPSRMDAWDRQCVLNTQGYISIIKNIASQKQEK